MVYQVDGQFRQQVNKQYIGDKIRKIIDEVGENICFNYKTIIDVLKSVKNILMKIY